MQNFFVHHAKKKMLKPKSTARKAYRVIVWECH